MDDGKLNDALPGVWDSLTDEQKERAKDIKTPEEFLSFAGREAIELPDEAIEAVSGGGLFHHFEADKGIDTWEVVADDSGEVKKTFSEYGDAYDYAFNNGYSTYWYTWDELKELRDAYEQRQKEAAQKKSC